MRVANVVADRLVKRFAAKYLSGYCRHDRTHRNSRADRLANIAGLMVVSRLLLR